MRAQFPNLATSCLKRNLKLGTRMEVHTLSCNVYRNMIKKDGRSFTLTRLTDKGGLENQPQWEHFKELVEGQVLIVYSFWEFEEFWPSGPLTEFYNRNKKSIIELSEIVSLFFPGEIFQSAAQVSSFLAERIQPDDSLPEDETFRMFNDLSDHVCSLRLKSHQDIVTLLSLSSPALAGWLDKLTHVTARRKALPFSLADNIREGVGSDSPVTFDLTDETLSEIFSPDGPAGRTMPDYERRPEQLKYATTYLRSLESDRYLLAEAGTGTGKSLAYLVPALLYNLKRGSTIVVSTHTRSLQHQLFYKDLMQAEEMIGQRLTSLILKGRGNYLCVLKMHIARAIAPRRFDPEQLAELASVLVWKDLTRSGDLSELGGLSSDVRREISCDAAFCPGPQCAHYRGCFFFRARRAALKSDIVVTNHALFFSDLLSESDILGKPGVIVFDEAHQVERVATESLTGELSRSTLSGIFDPLEPSDPGMPGKLSNVTGILVHQAEDESAREAARDVNTACNRLISECNRTGNLMFLEIGRYVESHKMVPSGYSRRERLIPGHSFLELAVPFLDDLSVALKKLQETSSWLIEQIDQTGLEAGDIVEVESIQSVMRSIGHYLMHIHNICNAADEGWVRWLEVSSSGWCSIKIAPVEVGEMMKQLVFDKYRRVLFTSATMTVERDFSFIEERLGMDRISAEEKMRSTFGSSFDFQSQVRFICTAYLPSPRTDYYQKKLSQLLGALFRKVERNTLVLFTSYMSIRQTVSDLAGRFPRVLAQTGPDSAEKMLRDFKQLKPAILLGTESFWHGVDLPGDLLELLVITRLPFSVPGDPIDTARMEIVEKRGANSFACYSLPAAVLRFKQGFGRLIRTATDQGIIIVTDNRLVKSNFGHAFLNSVPSEVEIATCWEDVSNSLELP